MTDDLVRVRDRAMGWLRAYGPATVGEVLRALDLDDAWDERDLYEVLLDDPDGAPGVFPLLDGRLCDLPHLLDGLTLTHHLTSDEREAGAVTADPDLAPLYLAGDDRMTLPLVGAAGALGEVDLGPHRLTGPEGWLPAEDVLVLRLVDGRLEVSGLAGAPPVDPLVTERLRRAFDALDAQHDHPLDEVELVSETLARYPRLFAAPQAPLQDLLAAEDLVATETGIRDADQVDDDEDGDLLVHHLRDDHDLDDDQVRAVLTLQGDVLRLQGAVLRAGVEAARAGVDDPVAAAVAGAALDVEVDLDAAAHHLAVALADPKATAAMVEDVLEDDPLAAACLLALLERVRPASKARAVRANTAWVRARALELAADDHALAERELRRAVELDPDHGPATWDLAGYLSDRGQAGAALGLLHQMEGPGVDELVDLLRPFAGPGPMSAGRNDPCPCGSGRKHKVCCAPRGGWPLADRMDWVGHKLFAFYGSAISRDVVDAVARATRMDEPGAAGTYRDTAALNLTLFEGGVVEDLCDLRGSLLPADELSLLRSWSRVRAGVYELVEVGDDGEVELLDLRTGSRAGIVDRSLAGNLDVGDAVLAWFVPEGGGVGPVAGGDVPEGERLVPFHSVVRLPDRARAALLDLLDTEPSAVVLGAWLRDLHAPPKLATTAGDPAVSIERTYRVASGPAARRALAGHLEEDPDEGSFLAFEERDGDRWLAGSVTVEGDELTLTTTSAPRLARLAALVAEVAPDAELVDEQRVPMADLLAVGDGEAGRRWDDEDGFGEDGFGEDDGDLVDLDDLPAEERAAVAAELEAMMVRHEDAWVDTPLPALGGATPREALDDPTRRQAVLRLLDEFQDTADTWTGVGRGMDPARLRRLLGL
jgi:hypothetical protein